MNEELILLWQDLATDFKSAVLVWQLVVLGISFSLAWIVNGLLRPYIMQNAPESWRVGIGSIKRVLFPLSSLLFIVIGAFVLEHWQHVSLLKIVSRLMIAMAVIRLGVYALRYIFAPSEWLRAMEHAISTLVWLVFVMHVSGILPSVEQWMSDVKLSVGKSQINLLLATQALLTIILTVLIALWASRILENRLMANAHLNINMRVVIGKVIRIIFLIVAVLIGLSAVGLDLTMLSVFGGALGVGLGFGLQKVASNYVSGFIILLEESLQLGDFVTIDRFYGHVKEMRSRYMILRQTDGTEVIIPNETLITSAVVNHNATQRHVQIKMPIQVGYDTNLREALALMVEVAQRQSRVMTTPAPDAKLTGFGESGIDLNLSVWVPDPENGSGGLQSAIYLDLWDAFQARGISIPYPQREIRILDGAVNAGKPDVV
jgi:small-conductance mechanosensitive channel